MGEPATSLLDRWEPEDEPTPSGAPGVRWVAVVALIVAVLAIVVATVVMVATHPAPEPDPEPAPRSIAPTAAASPPTTPPPVPFSTSEYTGATVGNAVVGLEAAGAEVELYDARLWERTVTPDWVVCIASELYLGDTPSGIVQISAVPAGDPCP
jgi:hypothetical protein